MTNWTRHLDNPAASAPPKRGFTKDTAEACRGRASADLLRSVAVITVNQRRVLERSAEAWMLRADMLARVEASGRSQTKGSPSGSVMEVDNVRL